MGIDGIIRSLKRPSHLDFPEENRVVKEIVDTIKKKGKSALFEYIERFDGARYVNDQDILVSREEFADAYNQVPKEFIDIIKRAKARIRDYHGKQKQNSWFSFGEDSGIILGKAPTHGKGGIRSRGRAAYPSSVLMNAIPAQIAG